VSDRTVDYDSEMRVLSSMMHSDKACIEGLYCLGDSDFTDYLNRDLFNLIKAIYSQGAQPTLVEIYKEGQKLGFIQNTNDVQKIKNIAEHHIDDENISYWIDQVKRATKTRAFLAAMKKASGQYQESSTDIDDLLTETTSSLFALAMDDSDAVFDTPESIADLGIELINDRCEKYRRQQEELKMLGEIPLEGAPSGFKSLDQSTLGMKPGELIILGAQTGHGKTAFALNVARAASVDSGHSVLYINTEMSRQQIAARWGAILSDVALNQIRGGSLSNEQKETVVGAYNRLRNSKFYAISIPNLTPQKMDVLTRKYHLQKKIDLVILDYVGRMEKIKPDLAEWQVLEQIIKMQKILAQNLGIACFVLVQLNSDGSLQGAKRMENECDLMLKLFQVENKDDQEKVAKKIGKDYEEFNYRLYVSKARDAESGVNIPLVFDKPKQQIREAAVRQSVWADVGTVYAE
jgi:replicative DNA helicase